MVKAAPVSHPPTLPFVLLADRYWESHNPGGRAGVSHGKVSHRMNECTVTSLQWTHSTRLRCSVYAR